jgi:diguanylate cyclase (GGDEF)-like protein
MNILSHLEKQRKSVVLISGFTLIALIGYLDYLTGYEIVLSSLYALPISLIAWLTGRQLGILASVVSILVLLLADLIPGHSYANNLIPLWNTLIRLTLFLFITFLVAELRDKIGRERALARTDYLTGAANRRYFTELLQAEINRSKRYHHSFVVAYIDLDNFKSINDQWGHDIGDQVLCNIVRCARKILRKTDSVARLSGDEFAFLLPQTNQEQARHCLSRLQTAVAEEMRLNHWPITLSIGVLTCLAPPVEISEVLKISDELMYSVKRDRKNGIKYSTCIGSSSNQ